MRNLTCFFALLIINSVVICAQTRSAPKPIVKTSDIKTVEREKFDPRRVAADDLKAAITKATAENKRIILDVGGEWCGWCRLMDNYLIENVALGKLRDGNFVWLKINFSEENENKEFLAAYPEIKGYPHLFVLEKDGKFLYSQDTSALEDGKSYDLQRFTDFLAKWSPAAKPE